MSPKSVLLLIESLVLLMGTSTPSAATVSGKRTNRKPLRKEALPFPGIDRSIMPFCRKQPTAILTAGALLMVQDLGRTEVTFNVFFYIKNSGIGFVEDLRVTSSGAVRASSAWFGDGSYRPQFLSFLSQSTERRLFIFEVEDEGLVISDSSFNFIQPYTLTKVNISAQTVISEDLISRMSSLRAAMIKPKNGPIFEPEEVYLLFFDEKREQNVLVICDPSETSLKKKREMTMGSIDYFREMLPLFPSLNSNSYHLAFTEFMENITTGVAFRVDNGSVRLEPDYFLLQEFLGCPPSPCYKMGFTQIVQFNNKSKRIYYNYWYFEFKQVKKRPVYLTAKRDDLSFWQFMGSYRFKSFIDTDMRTFIIDDDVVHVFDPKGRVFTSSRNDTLFHVIPFEDALFYWRETHTLYHMNVSSVTGISLQSNTKVCHKSLEEFLGFDIFKKQIPSRIVDAYIEQEAVYIFVSNWYITIPRSAFGEKEHRFFVKTGIKRKCVSHFLGCPLVKGRKGLPNATGYSPCSGVVETKWTSFDKGKNCENVKGDETVPKKGNGWLWACLGLFSVSTLIITGAFFGVRSKRKGSAKKAKSRRPSNIVVLKASAARPVPRSQQI